MAVMACFFLIPRTLYVIHFEFETCCSKNVHSDDDSQEALRWGYLTLSQDFSLTKTLGHAGEFERHTGFPI